MKKRLLCVFALCCLLMGTLPAPAADAAEPIASGDCGDALAWTLDPAGTLTVSGTGAMDDWVYNKDVPWYALRERVLRIVVEDGVTSLGTIAFAYCANATEVTLPESLTIISDYVFAYCTALVEITLPASVTQVAPSAFSGCTALASFAVADGNSVYDAEDGVLYRSSQDGTRTLVCCPAGRTGRFAVPDGVTDIGERAFYGCAGLTAISLSDSVNAIGAMAFQLCTGLTGMEVPDGVTEIPSAAFSLCTGLTRMVLPASIAAIGATAYSYCTALTDVYFAGTAEDWEAVVIGDDNAPLTAAAMHCGSSGSAFADVTIDTYYYDAVAWATENGVLAASDGLFLPNADCTRAQVATLLYHAAGTPETDGSESGFSDVAADSAVAAAVAWAAQQEIISGDGEGRFAPDATCSRAELLAMLYRYLGSPETGGEAEGRFSDVAPDAYYAAAAAWAAETGVACGDGNGRLLPDSGCTRAQAVTFLYRALG
ncbi:MAG: leucine-rich repeat protein [Oscillospiraceae bacterium]|nr:leucine-rich repeat protein [Oscillospiraceae bacterium]